MPDITKIKVADESESSYKLYPRNEEFAKRSCGGGSGVQPDLNQNDETAADYVKNRPFYTGDPVETVLLEEPEAYFQDLDSNRCFHELSDPLLLEVGQTYQVSWNGTIYECVGTDYYGNVALGNLSIIDKERQDTGEPFVYSLNIITTTDWSMFHNISISSAVAPITKIDEKYLPELPYMDKVNPTGTGAFSLNRKANTTVGVCSFTEGIETTASGYYSHAEGFGTTASGYASHAEGYDTTASGDYSHAEGKYNIEDTANKYAHIVGNGTSVTSRSNAHTLDWSGNAWYAGTVEGKSLILQSSTEGSTKKFKITVDDSGTLTATEVS